ncbi:MAG: FitA-like ribbon-helix-helix domain-containing protein [Vicinamibacteria bacterium]
MGTRWYRGASRVARAPSLCYHFDSTRRPLMAQVLVRGLSDSVVARLKKRARDHRRSLQAEVRLILEQSARPDMTEARRLAARIRRELAGRKHTDSGILVAEDRDR